MKNILLVVLTVVAVATAGDDQLAERLGLDRQAVNRQELPYSPADGSEVAVNPPAFTWLPPLDFAPGKYRYVLEYSRDPVFRDSSTVRVAGQSSHIHIPRRQLAAGDWYWRSGVELPQGAVWTSSRRFRVTPAARSAPYPDLAAAVRRIPAERPRLFVTSTELPELRRRVAAGEFAAQLAQLKKLLQPGFGAELPPEPDYLPKTRGPEWGEAWKNINRNLIDLRRMEEFALVYLFTGELEYGLEAKRRLLHFFSWNPEGSTSLWANDDQAMWIMRRGVGAYDWTAGIFTPAEREQVEKTILNRVRQYYAHLRRLPMDSRVFGSHDNGYLYNLGEALISLLPEHPELFEQFDYIMTVFWGCLPIYGGDAGGWNEGPAYWAFTMDRVLRFLCCVRNAAGLDLAAKPFFANTGYYIVYGWPGRSRQTSFGDGPTNMPNQVEKAAVFAALTGNPVFLKPLLDCGQKPYPSILTLLAAMNQPAPAGLSHLPKARHFDDIGFVALRTDLDDYDNDVGLLFQSNPFGLISHNHNTQNCFLLEAYSEPLAISSGYYDYHGSPHHARWTRETRAHCGITLDGGQGQKRDSGSTGRIIRFLTGEEFDLAVGDATVAYDGRLSRSLRTIVHVRPGLFVLYDENDAEAPVRIEYNLHARQPIGIDQAGQTAAVSMPKAGLKVAFFADRPWQLSVFDNFDPPIVNHDYEKYPNQYHLRAAEEQPTGESRLVTVLAPFRKDEEGRLPTLKAIRDDRIRGVELSFPDGGRVLVGFSVDAAAGETELAGVRRPGRVIALKYAPDGQLRTVFPE